MKKVVFLAGLIPCLIWLASLQSGAQARAGELAEGSEVAAVAPVIPVKIAAAVTSGGAEITGGGGVPQPAGGGPPPGEVAPLVCPCCGIIWHADNQEFGETYGESPIGGLSETCWIVGQVWTEAVFDETVVPERWTFAIRPGTVVWIRGHRGGTAWLFAGDEGAVWEDIKKQAEELRIRDGEMTTGIVMLPDQASAFRLVVRLQTAAVPLTSTNPGSGSSNTNTSSVIAVSQTVGQNSPTVNGPAIVETMTRDGKALVVKVNRGKTFLLENPGTPFPFPSQAALDERWLGHKAEFHQKYPDGQELEL